MFYLIFFALFFFLFWLLLVEPKLRTGRRLQAYMDPQPKQEKVPWQEFAKSVAKVEQAPFARRLEELLLQAGVEKSAGEFLLQSMLLGLLLSFLALPFLSGSYWLLPLLFTLGLFFPRLSLSRKIKQRQSAFALQLGDALNLMSNSLKAGYSFLQAVELVSREMNPPISREFSQVVREVSLGATVEEALENLASRIYNDDLELVLLSVNIQRQVGGNLSEIFDKVAETIRERLRIKGEINTLTAQGRLSSIIILLLPPVLALFMFAMNPQYMLLLVRHPAGQLMLLLGLFGQGLGILLIRRIIAIDV